MTQRQGVGDAQAGLNRRPTLRVIEDEPGPWLQLFAPNRFVWTAVELGVPDLPSGLDGLRLIHLSDLHFTHRWYGVYDRLLERIAQWRADLVLLTGDLVDKKSDYRRGLPQVRRLFDGLKSRFGSFTILGNHDGHLLSPWLRQLNTTLLHEQRLEMTLRGSAVELIGLPGVDRSDLDLAFLHRLPERQPDSLRVILSHYPDQIRHLGAYAPDLVLAGHTHGGQICLPGRIPLMTHDALPRRYASGIHRLNDTWLVVSRGMGFTSLPIRTFCAAQTIAMTLRRA